MENPKRRTKYKGKYDVTYDIKETEDCDDKCKEVKEFIKRTVKHGLKYIPASLTRSRQPFIGGSADLTAKVYSKLNKHRGYTDDIVN